MRLVGLPSALGCLVKSKGVAQGAKIIKENLFFMLHQMNRPLPVYEELMVTPANIAETFAMVEGTAVKAEKGTIRGDFGTDIQNNAIHASEDEHAANKEMDLIFLPHEIQEWKR